MQEKNYLSGTNKTVLIENSWHHEHAEDKNNISSGLIFIALIIFTKVILLF